MSSGTDPRSKGPTVGVVVCTHLRERADQLAECIASVQGQTRPPDDLVIVADGPVDLAADVAQGHPGIRVECTGANRGVSAARNCGVAALTTDIVVFLDDDATADAQCLAEMIAAMTGERVVGVSGRSLPNFESAPPSWFPVEFYWAVGCSYRGMPTTLSQVRNFQGGCAAVRRDRFTAVGGFSEELGYVSGLMGGGEEADFCLRVLEADPEAEFWYQPTAVCHHRVPSERLRAGYFWQRCYDEGILKQRMSRRRAGASLSAERSFALGMPKAVLGHLVHPGEAPMAFGLFLGVLAVLSGMLRGRVQE